MILPVLLALPSPSDDKNVSLDDERLQDAVPKGLQKVELDLDDALFLEFEEESPPADVPPEPSPTASTASQEKTEGRERDHVAPLWKKLSLGAALFVVVFLVAAVAVWLFRKPEPKINTRPAQPSAAAPPVAPPPVHETKTELASRRTYFFDPFVVEYTRNDRIYFLTCRIYVPGAPNVLAREMDSKTAVLRDAIFRYLKSAELGFLTNPENEKKFKEDLLAVMNKSLNNGQATEILVEGYVVK